MSAAKRTLLVAASLLALVAVSVVGAAGGAPPGKDRENPSAPKNLRVTAVTQELVRLAWDASTDNTAVAGYYIFGDRGKATLQTRLDTPEYTLSGLACGQSSNLTVIAFDDAQNRSEKATLTVSSAPCTDTLPPTTPGGFIQVATSDDAVVLAWNPSADNVGVVGYGVYRNMQWIANPSDPTVPLAGLACGSSYDYTVDAVDAAGNHSLFGRAYVRTGACPSSSPPPPAPSPDTQAPSTPSGLAAASITQTALTLSWNASTDNVQVTGYDLYRDGTKVASPSSPGASQSGLACGTSYAFAVEALDAAGNRSSRATLTTSTSACSTPPPPPAPSPDTQAPSTPSGLAAASITQTALTLSWNASTDNVQVTGYDLYRDGTKVASPSSPGASQSGLVCGTSYAFAVEALDAAGNRSSRATLTTSTSACSTTTPPPTDTQPPSTPTGLGVASATRTSASLSWNASTDNVAVAGYRSYRDGAYQSTTTQPPTTVSGLSCGSAYTFAVDAFDEEGNASNRASVIGSTLACPDTQAPSAPTGVVASSRTATSIALIWNASTDNVGVVGYGLYRPFAATSSSSSTTGIFSGLTCNTNYTLAVDAYDAAGNRSDLTTVMVATTACPDTTPPSAPTGLAASSVTQTGLALAWNASSDNVGVTSYDVYRNGTKVATATSNSSSQTGLTCGTSYTFGVVARDAAGNSSPTASMNVSTSACAPLATPTWTSSIADGQTVQTGATWSATVNPAPDSVEFWATPDGGASNKLKTDTGPGYDVVLNLAPGSYVLGVCAWYGTSRTCFDDRKSVTITSASTPTPPTASYYYNFDFSQIAEPPWTSIQTHAQPGYYEPTTPVQQSSDGRVSLVGAPDGVGKALRFELQNGDTWPLDTSVDRSQLRMSTQATWNKSALQVGDVRWFDYEIYMPTAFDFPRTNWFSLIGIHPGSDSWGACDLGFDGVGSNSVWMTWKVAGGSTIGSTANLKYIKLWQLTNADGSKYSPSYNRRIHLVVGARFAPDNTGWLEIWVDGVNVFPRTNRPTMWAGDTSSYLKIGPYKSESSPFPSGKSVIYFTRVAIGTAQPSTS